jgi:hypothetical protein
MENQKGIQPLLVIMIVSFVAVVCIAAFFLIQQYFVSQQQPQNQNITQQQNTQTDQTAGWNTYKPDNADFEFKYPETLNTKYASFDMVPGLYPAASVIAQNNDTAGNIINGCFVPAMDTAFAKTQPGITINNMQFCLTTESSPGAGQLYNTYYYTTLHNGSYYTLDYVVHTLNGCSPYMGTPDYQPCTDFMNNYDSIVMRPIQESVATLTFSH